MSKCYLNKQGWRVRTWKSCILYELHLTKFACIYLGVLGFFRRILVYWEYRIALTWNVNSTVEEGRKKNALIKWIVGFLIFFHINATDFCKEWLSIFRGAWRMRSLSPPWRNGGKVGSCYTVHSNTDVLQLFGVAHTAVAVPVFFFYLKNIMAPQFQSKAETAFIHGAYWNT